MPQLGSDLVAEWRSQRRILYERLAANFRVIRFDGRGQGQSQRQVASFSLETVEADLDAVMNALELDQVNILASMLGEPGAISYAAHYPDRVRKLVLVRGVTSAAQCLGTEIGKLISLVDDWDLFSSTAAHVIVGWEYPETARDLYELFRSAMDPSFLRTLLTSQVDLDATHLVGNVRAEVLVLHGRGEDKLDGKNVHQLVSKMAHARLAYVPAEKSVTSGGNNEAIAEIEHFLSDGSIRRASHQPDGTRTHEELTRRERETLELLIEGLRNREIADRLGVSIHTVERHVATIYLKLGVQNRAEATRFAVKHSLAGVTSAPAG